MVKFCAYYGLCPLIDQRSLLGVSADSENGSVIVTLGKNIVIRYKLLNQKQVGSWSTKYKITSPVIYNAVEDQYVAVFDQNQLRMWSRHEEQLDKIKKYRFEHQIHCVLPQCDGSFPIVVFQNGFTALLNNALENRKEAKRKAIIKSHETIEDCCLLTYMEEKFIAFHTLNSKKHACLYIVSVSSNATVVKHTLLRENQAGIQLSGYCFVQGDAGYQLLTIWSDGHIYSMPAFPHIKNGFPGVLLHVMKEISTKTDVTLIPLSSKHIAVYGADVNEEGALLLIFNIQLQVIHSRQYLKVFSSPPRMWHIGTNLILPLGQNLIVVSYKLDTERVLALVGTHKKLPSQPASNGEAVSSIVERDWTTGSHKEVYGIEADAPVKFHAKLKTAMTNGCFQSIVFEELLPQLIQEKEVASLCWCLQQFHDIPESFLVLILKFCLQDVMLYSGNNSKIGKNISPISKSGDSLNGDGQNSMVCNILSSPAHCSFLDIILNVSFSGASLLQYLGEMTLSNMMVLLAYLISLQQVELGCLEEVPGTCSQGVPEEKRLEWVALLLDTFYRECLLSKDPKVLMLLRQLRNLIDIQLGQINPIVMLMPMLVRLKAGKTLNKKSYVDNKSYSIEQLSFDKLV